MWQFRFDIKEISVEITNWLLTGLYWKTFISNIKKKPSDKQMKELSKQPVGDRLE